MRRHILAAICISLAGLIVALAPTQARALGIIRDAEIEQLLKDYSYPIFAAAGFTPSQVEIHLVDDPNINAFVYGGQKVFFHTGLLLESETPNMVIGVIAHETGHISAGHLARGDAARRDLAKPGLVATILGFGSLLVGAGDLGLALITGGQHLSARSYLAYSRGQEAAADAIALRLLDATEQSPAGIIEIMNIFAGRDALIDLSRDPYAQAHPMPRDRVTAYVEGARKSAHFDAKDSAELQFRHDMARAKLYGFLDHPNVTMRRYRGKTQSAPARYALAVAHHRAGRADDALALIQSLTAQYPQNAWFHELEGQIDYESGRARDGIAPYKRAIALAPKQPLLLIGLAACQLSLAANDPRADAQALGQAAEKNLRAALRLDPENFTAYFQLAKAYGQLERVPYAEWALAEYYALLENPKAKRHAKRAIDGLRKTSPEYLRASDILNAS